MPLALVITLAALIAVVALAAVIIHVVTGWRRQDRVLRGMQRTTADRASRVMARHRDTSRG
jgi:multisubunit Na+/H+ antiporter MnhF subunit